MDAATMQVLTGSLGVVGALGGVWLGHVLANRTERSRAEREDAVRWLDDQRAIATQFVASARSIEKATYGACAFLRAPEGTPREVWLDGALNLLASPPQGSTYLTAVDREILLEMNYDLMDQIDQLMALEAEVSLLFVGPVRDCASTVIDLALSASGQIEAYSPAGQAYAATFQLRDAVDEFVHVTQQQLRIPGTSTPSA